MGDAIDRLRALSESEDVVSLSFLSKVKSHKRTSKTGKVFDVEAYVRTLRGMSLPDLADELRIASGDRTRTAQIANEVRRRKATDRGTRAMSRLDNEEAAEAAGRAKGQKLFDTTVLDALARAAAPKKPSEMTGKEDRATSVQNPDGSLVMGEGYVVVNQGMPVRPAQKNLADAQAQLPEGEGFEVKPFKDGKIVNTSETLEEYDARTAHNRRAAAEWSAKSHKQRWESLDPHWRRAVERSLEEDRDNDSWAMDDEETADHVSKAKALLRKLQTGEPLSDEDYRELMGRVQAMDD